MRFISLFWIVIFSFLSCKEERDEIPPSIFISAPSENLTAAYNDEIIVSASISDNEIIRSVQLSLISAESGRRVLKTESFQPNSSNFELREVYEISDSLLPGGEYYFRVEAKDDDNTFAAFRFINISSFPQRKISCIVACSDQSTTVLYEDQNDFSFNSVFNFSTPYLSSELNSFDQHYWFIPANGNQVQVMDLRSRAIVFDEDFVTSRNNFFGASTRSGRNVFISTKEGELQGYNSSFRDNYTYLNPAKKQLGKIAIGERFILQDENSVTSTNQTIAVLFRSSGNLKKSVPTNHPIVDFFFLEDELALLFQNDSNGGLIQELSIDDGSVRRIRNTPDSILAIEQISKNEYLISTANKIQRYAVNQDNLVDYLMIGQAITSYDWLNNQLYVGSEKSLSLYNYPQFNPILTTNFSSPIKGVDLRYNY